MVRDHEHIAYFEISRFGFGIERETAESDLFGEQKCISKYSIFVYHNTEHEKSRS